MEGIECKDCMFCEVHTTSKTYESKNEYGKTVTEEYAEYYCECRRYPTAKDVRYFYWCGEYKPRGEK
jgi:hypothetical protein